MRAQRETRSADETQRLGLELGAAAEPGDVLLLLGSFGAGKTTLVQGIAHGLGIEEPVTSPSFVIAHEHRGRIPLYHVDLYRIEQQLDRPTLEALAEYFESDGLCAVEWPDTLPPDLTEHATRIEIVVVDETTRRLTIDSGDARLRDAFRGSSVVRR
jgi:tRNA threonylcarbamoyladenosine biosynthesis protein TsaE